MSESTPRPAWPPWVEGWVLPYVQKEALWPVAVALLGHVVMVLTPLMLAILRVGSVAAGVVLGLLAAATVYILRMEWRAVGRPGAVAVALGLTWLAAVGLTALAMHTPFI